MKSVISLKHRWVLGLFFLALGTWSCSDPTSNAIDKETGGSLPTPSTAAQGAMLPEALFTIVDQPQLSAEQARFLSVIRERPTTAEVHLARLANTPALLLQKGNALVLNVSPGRLFVAVGEWVTKRGPDDISWSGALQNQFGSAGLVLTKKGITGTIRTVSATYWFEPISGGLHALIRVDQSKFPPQHSSEYPSGALIDTASTPTGDAVAPEQSTSTSQATTSSGPNSGPDIDLLVVYTPSAASATWDINGLIQRAVDETNESYGNSNIYANVILQHTAQISYNESGRSYKQHVDAMQNRSDGIMDNINSLRNQYLADVVVLIVNDSEACGRAYEILASMTTAFAAVHYNCAAGGPYVFGHEIGHLQGSRHDRAVDSNNEPFQYGHGYVDPNDNWHTIMAYPNACYGCPMVQYWSNPDVVYPLTGQPMGTDTYEDNARVLNRTKYDIRDFRTLPPPSNFTLTNRYSYGENPNFTWTPVPEADHHTVYRCITESYYSSWCFQSVGGGLNEWTDWEVTIVDPYGYPYYGDCPKTAIYYATATNRTGESSYYNTVSACVEAPYY